MNIIEALKTGRPLKRAKSSIWIGADHVDAWRANITREDMLADDWEVRPEIVEITKEDFFKSVAQVAKEGFAYHSNRMTETYYLNWMLEHSNGLWEEFKKQGKLK